MEVLDASFIAGATTLAQLPPPTYAEIAFAGRSNVGKSSLINNLVNRKKLVRTSSAPGCTRALNLFRIRLRTDEDEAFLDLVDLPGYGYAQRSKAERRAWGPLIEGFLQQRPGLRGVVVIIDVRRGFESEDSQLLDFLDSTGLPSLVVATKLDKLPASKRKPAIALLRKDLGRPVLPYSSVTGDGRELLWSRLLRLSSVGVSPTDGADQADGVQA